jgi:short-subunit dehydrogenase
MTEIALDGASVLVTGATGALGSRIARELAARGARLTITGRSPEALAALGIPGATVVPAELLHAHEPERVVAAAVAAHGGLDGVVQATGVVAFGALLDTPDDVLYQLVETNLLAPLRLTRAAIPALQASTRTPFLATISAVVAENPVAGMAPYSATKAALTAADRALARELRRDRIHVLDIRPPHTETGLVDRAIAGTAPTLPTGLDPDAVARRIVAAIAAGERDLPSDAFAQ